MYIPKENQGQSKPAAIEFMKKFNFGIIVSVNEQRPIATHIPFSIIERGEDLVLQSHIAKGNPQWQNFDTQEILVIFSEPHAYISPKHYNKEQSVPTWNYISIHAYGTAKILESEAEKFQILQQMILDLEPQYLEQWNGLQAGYKTAMANGIVAFEITITDLQINEKLSQDKKENERQRISKSLLESDDTNEQQIGKYME